MISIAIMPFLSVGQNELSNYEDKLYEACGDCNNAKMSIYLNQLINQKDSIIDCINESIRSSFDKKILSVSTDEDKTAFCEMLNDFNNVVSEWKEDRLKRSKLYSSIYNGGTMESIQYGIAYVYVSDNIISFLNAYYSHASQILR